jgi:protein-S-isoprenylcysteine O-methyltransferase Ste14
MKLIAHSQISMLRSCSGAPPWTDLDRRNDRIHVRIACAPWDIDVHLMLRQSILEFGIDNLSRTMTNQAGKIPIKAILLMLFFVVVIPLLPLLITRRWDWWEAWAYALVNILGFAFSRALAGRRHPDLLRERARFLQHEDAKPWDKILSPLVGLGGGLVPLVAGLDALFGWSGGFTFPWKILALALILAGFVLASYALIENRFFSGMVRIQTERGHKVVSSGPYRWMRHPGYAGALLAYLATPVLLDSAWAFLPAVVLSAILVVRTRLEDRTLQDELAGYRDYAQRVHYRLIPGVW